MTKKGDSYFGRGTTDDKGPALAALYGARAAMEAGVPINIRFLWEFEEEIGSPNFEKLFQKRRQIYAPIQLWFPTRFGCRETGPQAQPGCEACSVSFCSLKPGR